MSELPWVRFYPSDWLAGTRGLSAVETGIYITLVAMMYERGAPLPDDAPRLARLCGASLPRFQTALQGLLEGRKIVRTPEGLWNLRVEKEQEKRSKIQLNSVSAANKRWEKAQRKQWGPRAVAMPEQSDRNAIPETRKISTSSTVVEPVENSTGERSEKLAAALRRMGRLKDGRDDEEAA